MAHHKRKRPKHRRGGCLLCKPHKLPAKVKAERRKSRSRWLSHEQTAEIRLGVGRRDPYLARWL